MDTQRELVFISCACVGKYVGNRPIKLRKSSWKERNIDVRARKERERLGPYPKIR